MESLGAEVGWLVSQYRTIWSEQSYRVGLPESLPESKLIKLAKRVCLGMVPSLMTRRYLRQSIRHRGRPFEQNILIWQRWQETQFLLLICGEKVSSLARSMNKIRLVLITRALEYTIQYRHCRSLTNIAFASSIPGKVTKHSSASPVLSVLAQLDTFNRSH